MDQLVGREFAKIAWASSIVIKEDIKIWVLPINLEIGW
jgi:hypothetical protein